MSNIEWGPLVDVDRKRPDWLKGDDKIRWYWPGGATTDWSQGENGFVRVKKVSEEGWGAIGSIRLPADHPHYQPTPVVDWSAPIEAVHEDGRVVPVKINMGPYAGNQYDLTPGLPNDNPEGFGHFTFAEDGSHHIAKWHIRNVATKPVRTAAEMLDRLEALARRMAEHHKPGVHYVTQMEPLRDEARAIVAEMTPPVDPDRQIVTELMSESQWHTSDANYYPACELALSAIKRGRELERGA